MTRTLFNQGWQFAPVGSDDWTDVNLPHDAMLHEERDPNLTAGHHSGWYPGGSYVYRKTWRAPQTGQRVGLLFEGVYRKSSVMVNGVPAGGCLGGYTEFTVPLDDSLRWGEDNLIEVYVDNSEVPNSRWYTGSGIYRHVWLIETGATRITSDGCRVVTRSLGAEAVVDVEVHLEGPDADNALVRVELTARNGSPSTIELSSDGGIAQGSLTMPDPQAWSSEDPHLYECSVIVSVGGHTVDSRDFRVGLRTVTANAAEGLLINGQQVLLRGACVHHDHGILGAATHRDAEFRRARILKEQGFNAIRSSHNPLSRDALDACDEVGLYVMDELWDSWLDPKTAHDLASRFSDFWEDDVDAFVAKNRNHPSVIMYSTGNEIGESGTDAGIAMARRISDRIRSLDPSRLITSGVNPMLNMTARKGQNPALDQNQKSVDHSRKRSRLQSEGFNLIMSKAGAGMLLASGSRAAGKAVEGVADTLDVIGYNYGTPRYRADRKSHPQRVVLGAETMTFHIAKNWALVESLPHVVGDFMWTGWDYLGESGLGSWSYGDEPAGMKKPYPWSVAGPGALDLLGQPGAPMLLARAVWGLDPNPAIAVRPVDRSGEAVHKAPWRASDAVPSWAWPGCDGKMARVEVYSAADHVELLLNERSLGRKRAGRRRGYLANFSVPYEPGELTAVAYTDGAETGRRTLRSGSTPSALELSLDRTSMSANGQDLAHLLIEVTDETGTVSMASNLDINVTVSGPATLAGLGSAHPAPPGPYTDADDVTWHGRCLAVLRAGRSAGTVTVTATAAGLAASTRLDIKDLTKE